jgi:hypothetical protein
MAAASYSPSVAVRLDVVRAGELSVPALAAHSRAALDVPLASTAQLQVAIASGHGVLVGAFQRAHGLSELGPVRRRGSGGPELHVAAGSLHVLLSLASPDALVACDETRIVNRHVRPLLRALAKTGHLAHFYGRDWVSLGGRPVAWVGFAHDTSTRRTAFEALVAVGAPYVVHPRRSLRGKEPSVVPVEPQRLATAILDAYARDTHAVTVSMAVLPDEGEPPAQPAWVATREEVIGTIGAGPDAQGHFRIGGDLLVSRDALTRLEESVVQNHADIGRLVDATLSAPGVALDGVRSLVSVGDCVTEALEASARLQG